MMILFSTHVATILLAGVLPPPRPAVTATRTVNFCVRDEPNRTDPFVVGVELQIRQDGAGQILSQSCKPFISSGTRDDRTIIPLPFGPTTVLRIRKTTTWKGKAHDPTLSVSHTGIAIDRDCWWTEHRVTDAGQLTLHHYTGRYFPTKYVEVDAKFDLVASVETAIEFAWNINGPAVFTYRNEKSHSMMFTMCARQSLNSDWCYSKMKGTFDDDGPHWHYPPKDGAQARGECKQWLWAKGWEVNWSSK
jgi:hypothetical protein